VKGTSPSAEWRLGVSFCLGISLPTLAHTRTRKYSH
jgi:hypothetical protein